MDKKITRRAVLGVAIAGLVATPFVTRNFRHKRSRELSDTMSFDHAYGKINFPLDKIDSDLPLSVRAKALDVFEKERSRWLTFRGVEGDVRLKKMLLVSRQEINEEGFFRLKFDLRVPSDSRYGEHVAHNVQMSLAESRNAAPRWVVKWKDRIGGRPDDISGTNEGKIEAVEVFTLLAPLLISGIIAVPNDLLLSMLQGMVLRLSGDPESNSYVFGPNATLTREGELIPTLRFLNGCYSGYVPKRFPNAPSPECTMTDGEQLDNFLFPRLFELKYVANGGQLTDAHREEITMEFMDSKVFVSPI